MAKIYREGFSVVWSGERSRDGSSLECHPIVNIIFIHGLRGHPRETWETPAVHTQSDGRGAKMRSIFRTKKKHREVPHDEASTHSHRTEPSRRQTIFWIEDLLPQDIPNARILTYGYNADAVGGFFQANNKNSISQHGQDLKAKLERELENEAPIIFVAHSLGGIIAKDALHRSKSARQRTKLIVFLGTPHRGSAFADWGQIASNLARLALQDSNRRILETLEVNNEVLDNIQEEFKTIVYEDGLRVHSFQEARGISGMKGLHSKVVDDFSSKVDLPSAQETVETIDGDHTQMTKFNSKDDSGYRAVSGVLKAFIGRLSKAQEKVPARVPLPSFNSVHSNAAATSAAKIHFMVPFQRNGDLVGREMYIQSLETKLCIPDRYCRVALVGLGGIGKTQIALEFASKHRKSDSMSVFWVHASTAERMENAYQDIAKKAGLVGAGDPNINQLQLVKQWLESEDSGDWVMVIDNADDEKVFFGEDEDQAGGSSSSSNILAHYFPQRPNGSILLTTRNKKLGVKFAAGNGVINIPEMSVSESKRLLMEKLEKHDYDDDDLTELVEVLENLPLALVQAAAFIGENSQTIGEYLQMYHASDASKIKLLSQNFEDSERHADSINPVAVTWAITFDQIRKNNPHAAELLSLMSMLDRQAIPKSLLPADEEVELEKAIGTLKAFSLITVEQNRHTFNLHRLVYLATRNWLNLSEELGAWTGKALVLLSERCPKGTYENREIWNAYLPHAYTVLDSNHLPASESIAQATLLFLVSQALETKGDYDQAEMTARKCLNLRRDVLGEKDFDTLRGLRNLGRMLWRQGKNEEAEKINRQALNGFEGLPGNEDLDTLLTLEILGVVLSGRGKYEAAENFHRRALSRYEKVRGMEHPETMTVVNNLANVLADQGKYEAAEGLYRKALKTSEKILGVEHPDTLLSVSNLAGVFSDQGKYETAEDLYRKALKAREKILGIEHPDTLLSVSSLATALSNQGKYEAAEDLHRKAIKAREKILGIEHPSTLLSVSNLAGVLSFQGKYDAAEDLYRKALKAREKILGIEHPDTLNSVSSLATALSDQGKYEAAEDLHRKALKAQEKILGVEHPDTLRSVHSLATVLEWQGQFEEAVILYQRALSGREKTLGKEHPDTFFSVFALANFFHNRFQYQDALPLYQRACAGLEKTLGLDHPRTRDCAERYSRMLDEMRRDSRG